MKLIIQVPCLNEEEHLPETLRELPRRVEGFDTVEWLIIDDGSTDATVDVARREGVDHIVRLTNNKGLASAFQAGMDASLKLGADVIVNTDADGQYSAADIPALVAPILKGAADMVVGDREVHNVERFSARKKRLQRLGSWVVRRASGTSVPDTTSGFRAYNREAALQLQVVSKFSYTLESLIQAGKMLVAVDHVPIATAPEERRPSRLHRGSFNFVRRSASTILRIYATYEPLRVFSALAIVLLFAALGAWSPFLIDLVRGEGAGHIQSIILGGVLMLAAVQVFAVGILADQLGHQRNLTQRTLERVRRIELQLGVPPSHYESNPRSGAAPRAEGADPDPDRGVRGAQPPA